MSRGVRGGLGRVDVGNAFVMTSWKKIQCSSCGGHGLVSSYTLDGSDFLGAEECSDCRGAGVVFVSTKGTIAQYPGGPFLGRLTKQELNGLSSL